MYANRTKLYAKCPRMQISTINSYLIPISLFFALTMAHWRNDFLPEILQFLNIRRCIMLLDLKDIGLGPRMRHLSSHNIFTVAMSDSDLTDYLLGNDFSVHKEAVVGDIDSMEWSNVMSQWYHPAKIAKLTWIIFYSRNVTEFNELSIPYHCLFILASKAHAIIQLHELYHVKGKTFFRKFGEWIPGKGLNVSPIPFYQRRYNLEGSELGLLRMQEPMCVHAVECAHVEIWFTMGKMMNFSTYAMTSAEAIEKPWLDPDSTSHVTSFHANLLSQDEFLLDSMAPIWQYTVYIYVKHEKDESSPFSAYIRPFSISIWISILSCVLLASACLFIISFSRGARKAHSLVSGFKAFDCVCNQGGAEVGTGFPERVAILLTRLLAVVIVPSYAGAIISFLTLQYPVYPFLDLRGLVDDASYKLGAVNNTFLVGYFEYSQNPLSEVIHQNYFEDQATMPVSIIDGLNKVCKQKFAFLNTEDGIKSLTAPCKTLRIPTPAFRTLAGMHLRPNCEFRAVFFYNLIRFQETGIIQKLATKPLTVSSEPLEHDSVAFEHITPLLAIMAIGITVSVLIFLVETRISPGEGKKLKFEGRKVFPKILQRNRQVQYKY